MIQIKAQTINLIKINSFVQVYGRLFVVLTVFVCLGAFVFHNLQTASAQAQIRIVPLPPTPFRIGEKDAVELRSKIKTNELVSAFYLIDETRTTYAASDSGLPLYVRKTSNAEVTPKETVSNYLVIGRPIVSAENRLSAVRHILEKMENV